MLEDKGVMQRRLGKWWQDRIIEQLEEIAEDSVRLELAGDLEADLVATAKDWHSKGEEDLGAIRDPEQRRRSAEVLLRLANSIRGIPATRGLLQVIAHHCPSDPHMTEHLIAMVTFDWVWFTPEAAYHSDVRNAELFLALVARVFR